MANKEAMDAYYRQKLRIAAAAKCFMEWKSTADAFSMLIQHTAAVHAQFNALMECLNDPSRRVDDNAYYSKLVHFMSQQVDALMGAWPEVNIDENGRVHGKPTGLIKPHN